jgi:phage tail-like protein
MAKAKSGISLPGTFTSHPKGAKPKSHNPRQQRTVEGKGHGARGPQRQVEKGPKHPGPKQHQIQKGAKHAGPKQHQLEPPRESKQNPRMHGQFRTGAEHHPDWAKSSPKHQITPGSKEDPDPAGNYYFALEINDGGGSYEVAHFMECSGLKNAAEVFEIQEGGYNGTVHKRAGQSRWENIILKYATSSSTFLLEWRDKFLQDMFGERTSYSGSIAIMNNAGTVVRRYHFTNAWPVSWEGPSLAASGSDLAMETLEIAHDGLRISTDAWSAKNETGR